MPNPKSMASGDLTITLSRVGSFRAGRHGDAMRKLLTFLIALATTVFAVVSPVSAQGFNGGGFNVGLGPFAPYQGPGDVITSGWLYWGSCAYVFKASLASTSTSMCDLEQGPSGASPGTAVGTLRGQRMGRSISVHISRVALRPPLRAQPSQAAVLSVSNTINPVVAIR